MNFLQYADGTNSLEKISSLIKLDNMETKIFLKLRDKIFWFEFTYDKNILIVQAKLIQQD